MANPVGLFEASILVLTLFALGGILIAFLLPHRIRSADITSRPEVREAFRANLIQTVTLILVVVGAAVALKQLAASMDQLQDVRVDQLADDVEYAEARLTSVDSDEQTRVDAITDLSSLHAKSPAHRFRIERDLLRFVQNHARLTDTSALAEQAEPPREIRMALEFLLTKGQEQIEPDWQNAGEGTGLVLANLDLRRIDLQGANLSGADLSRTLLQGADLRGARLDGTVLVGANLQGAKLQRAVLRGSKLADANLDRTILTEADLAEADLRGAQHLTWAQVRDAAIACSTELPQRLPLSSDDAAAAVPMLLVLRDCFQPRELEIPAEKDTSILFGSTLPDPVVVIAPELDLELDVLGRIDVIEAIVNAPQGSYTVTGLDSEGSVRGEGRLIAGRDQLVAHRMATRAPEPTATSRPPAVTATAYPTPRQSASMLTPSANVGDPGDEVTWGEEAFDPPWSGDIIASVETPTDWAALNVPTPRGFAESPSPAAIPLDLVGTPSAAQLPDRDCADFQSQEEAHAFFEAVGGPELDLHRLDTDGDGIACASGIIPDGS
jgi:uncharacterized protein YjbI with pentapeptide repeats